MSTGLPHVPPGWWRLRSRPVASQAFRERLQVILCVAMFISTPVVFTEIMGHPLGDTAMTMFVTVPWCAAITYSMVLAVRVAAEKFSWALFGDGSEWLAFSMHWADWWRLRRTTITPAQARPFYDLSWESPQPRLRTVEALVAAGAPPLSVMGSLEGQHYDLLRLITAGVPAATITAFTNQNHSERTLVDFFAAVPDLTPEDLTRFAHGGITTDRSCEGMPHRIMREQYARYGERASYFYALRFTDAEATAAIAQDLPVDALAAMTGLVVSS